MRYSSIATAAVAILAGTVAAETAVNPANPTQTAKGVQQPSARPVPQDPTVQGCFGSSEGLKLVNSSVPFNSRASCGKDICQVKKYNVAATYQGNQCFCGNVYPPKSSLLKDEECNVPCLGYDWDACGGVSAWTVYNTGLNLYGVEFSPDPSTTSSAASATAKPTDTPAESGAAPTSAAPAQGNGNGGGGGGNTAAIAAGVVVGIVAIAAIAGGVWFFLRRRRNREIEEEHRRNAAVNAFINGSKPPSSSGGLSMTDSRMDPVMAQRRMSDGSIADNQDYSRRILRVTNA